MKPNTNEFRVDCHVHTSELSACAVNDSRTMIEAAIRFGLDGIFLTEHNQIRSMERLEQLNKEYAPFQIYPGAEITIDGDDFLVLGIQDDRLNGGRWKYEDLYHFVKEKEGLLALAHPYRYWDGIDANIDRFHPDAIELYSYNMKPYSSKRRQKVRYLMEGLNARALANSDAHSKGSFCYSNVLEQRPGDVKELIQMLKAGAYHLDIG
jgi:predicted metal-dependent phosphoesterase TrpH